MNPPPVDETQFVPDGHVRPVIADHKRFGRFRVLALVGTGATGSVYRAHDEVLNRAVAIKALHPNCDLAVRTRFLHEARAIGSVLHPNILAVFDAGSEGDTPFMVMELANGSLRDAMRVHRLDIEAVRRVGIQIARALSAAHAAKILHRDVKPANILCAGGPPADAGLAADGDVWKLADFGIARLPDSTLTDTGQFLGSPSYAAPESLRAGEFTPSSDIYALAATLYEALAGAPPHGEHDMPSVVRKLEHDPPPLHLRCPVPRTMADAIMSALAREPSARPTAEHFAQRLAGTGEIAIIAKPLPPSRRIAHVAIATAVLAVCLLAFAINTRVRETTAPKPIEPKPTVVATPRVDRPPTPAPKPKPKPAAPRKGLIAPVVPAPAPPPASPDPWGPPSGHHGNIVDDNTARRMLEELERDARKELDGVRRFDRRGRRGRRAN